MLFAQVHQRLVETAHRVRVVHLGGGVDGLIVIGGADPRRTGGEACVRAGIPLHRGTTIVTAALGDDVERFGLGLALAAQDVVVIQAFYIPVLINGGKVRIGHTQFFALIDIRRTAHEVDSGGQHLGTFLPVGRIAAKATHGTGLVVIAPEQRIPAVMRLHPLLPCLEQFFQGKMVGRHQCPFVAVLVVHLQMMEVEAHRQFMVARSSVSDAVFQRGGGHFAHRHHAVDAACRHQFFQVFVDIAAIGVEATAIARKVVLIHFRFGNQIDHIKAESLDSLRLPETEDVGHFFPHRRVLPVQVCLCHIEQVQIPLAQLRHILPCRATELGHPVCGQIVRGSVLKDVVILILFLTGQCPLEPCMLGGGVVEHHIQHQANAALVRLADEFFQIFHRAVARVDSAVIRHVIAVVPLRRGKKRGKP